MDNASNPHNPKGPAVKTYLKYALAMITLLSGSSLFAQCRPPAPRNTCARAASALSGIQSSQASSKSRAAVQSKSAATQTASRRCSGARTACLKKTSSKAPAKTCSRTAKSAPRACR